ncbi:unnamed protein product, partial [Meganyctiphanes norvegica]
TVVFSQPGVSINNHMMDFLECKICHVPYDEEDHRPRTASCGHEFCTACIRALIKDKILECPTCRQKNKVDSANDLQINFDLIGVIRAFKTITIPLKNESETSRSGATNAEVCDFHCKALSHWCFKCQIWICQECLGTHTTSTDCYTANSTKAMESMKEKQFTNIDRLLNIFDNDTKFVSTKIQENKDQIKELLERAQKLGEEGKKLTNFLEQGKIHKEKLIESKQIVNFAKSPSSFSNGIKMLNQRKQILHSWCVRNLGTDTPLGLQKVREPVYQTVMLLK